MSHDLSGHLSYDHFKITKVSLNLTFRRESLREKNVVSCSIFPAYLLPIKYLLFLTLWVGVQEQVGNREQKGLAVVR